MRFLLARVFPWPLVGTGHPLLDHLASAAMLGLALVSRLLFLPDGPWEQDEALLASGVVDFNPAQHLPLPPGFPLWILCGRLVRLLGVADPLVALQVASAVLSVVGLWALVGLWDGLAGRGLALAGSLLAGCLPGVWFHAVRGFSETPAATLAIVALALWLRCGGEGYVAGVLAMTAAALVRPPLAPFFAIAVLAATWRQRDHVRRVVVAASLAVLLLLVVCLPLLAEGGGWELVWSATETHVGEHTAALGADDFVLGSVGFVRGLVSIPLAGVFLGLAILGLASWRSRLGWRMWSALVLGGWLAYLLLFLHGYQVPRYWVLVWLLLATPAVAGLLVALRRREVVLGVTIVAATASAAWVWPALQWVRGHPLPVVAAMRAVEAENVGVLVFDDQLFSFRDLELVRGAMQVASLRVSEIPERRMNLGGEPIWFLTEVAAIDVPSSVSSIMEAACSEPRVRRLSQERFLTARLVRNPVLAWRGASMPEMDHGERYLWCERQVTLLLPPLDAAGALALVVEPHEELAGLPLEAWVAGTRTLSTVVAEGRSVIRIPLPTLDRRNRLNQVVPVELRAGRTVRAHADSRELSIRLFRASVEAPPYTAPAIEFLPEAMSMQSVVATGTGFYVPELMGMPPLPAAWLQPIASFSFPAGAGSVGVELLAPRQIPAEVEIRLGTMTSRLTVRDTSVQVVLPVLDGPPTAHQVTLEISSSVFVPGGGDNRKLGVAVSRIFYTPRS
jgi:hypothetical protein